MVAPHRWAAIRICPAAITRLAPWPSHRPVARVIHIVANPPPKRSRCQEYVRVVILCPTVLERRPRPANLSGEQTFEVRTLQDTES